MIERRINPYTTANATSMVQYCQRLRPARKWTTA